MEQGFFHPSRGYWQAVEAPSKAVLDAYPPGTVKVPLKPAPDRVWDGRRWAIDPGYAARAREEKEAHVKKAADSILSSGVHDRAVALSTVDLVMALRDGRLDGLAEGEIREAYREYVVSYLRNSAGL